MWCRSTRNGSDFRYRMLKPTAILCQHIRHADHPRSCSCHIHRSKGCKPEPHSLANQRRRRRTRHRRQPLYSCHAPKHRPEHDTAQQQDLWSTKGQYSPTSPRGFVSKSSPYGTVEDPFRPAELCFGARGHFFARSVATDAPETVEILKAAWKHKGASVCEILQNCVIFNNGCYDPVYNKEGRKKNAIYVRHGQPLIFGENNEYGLVQEGFGLKVVKIGENGITEKDILVHDAHCEDNTLQLKLAMMDNEHGFPIALGVIRDVEAPTYDDAVHKQIEEVKAQKKYHNFMELLETNDTWEVV